MSPPTTILFCFFICIPLTNGDDVGASFFFSFFGSRSFIRCSSLLVPLTDERGHTLATTTSISHYTTSEIVFSSCSFRHSVCIDMFHVRKNNWNFSSFWLHLSNARKGKRKTKRICWRHYPTMCSNWLTSLFNTVL